MMHVNDMSTLPTLDFSSFLSLFTAQKKEGQDEAMFIVVPLL